MVKKKSTCFNIAWMDRFSNAMIPLQFARYCVNIAFVSGWCPMFTTSLIHKVDFNHTFAWISQGVTGFRLREVLKHLPEMKMNFFSMKLTLVWSS